MADTVIEAEKIILFSDKPSNNWSRPPYCRHMWELAVPHLLSHMTFLSGRPLFSDVYECKKGVEIGLPIYVLCHPAKSISSSAAHTSRESKASPAPVSAPTRFKTLARCQVACACANSVAARSQRARDQAGSYWCTQAKISPCQP